MDRGNNAPRSIAVKEVIVSNALTPKVTDSQIPDFPLSAWSVEARELSVRSNAAETITVKDVQVERKQYPTDVSDDEWTFLEPYLVLISPQAAQRQYPLREVFNALRWIALLPVA